MPKVGAKAAELIFTGLKRFQPILDSARGRDVNESGVTPAPAPIAPPPWPPTCSFAWMKDFESQASSDFNKFGISRDEHHG